MRYSILSSFLILSVLFSIIVTSSEVNASEEVDRKELTISAGSWSSFAIQSDRSLWAWGHNINRTLGDGTDICRLTPVKIMDNVVSVSSKDSHTAVIKTDGSLWTWGWYGYWCEISKGRHNTGHDYPTKMMDDVIAVSVSINHVMVIKNDGSLWAWGDNGVGQLGDGTTTSQYNPIKIMDDVLAVSSGSGFTMAIRNDGSLWAWGFNRDGQLGDGTTECRHNPVKIMDDVISIYSGRWHTFAIRTDGSLWTWGWNIATFNEIGNEICTANAPVKIMEDVVAVSTCGDLSPRDLWINTMIIRRDGSLWTWGNFIGDGTTNASRIPIKIMEDVASVSAGSQHSMVLRTDGSLWTWGSNSNGQIGDGTNTDRNSPAKIMEGVMLPGGIELVEPLPPPLIPEIGSTIEDFPDTVEPDTTSTPTLRFTIGRNNFLHNETVQQLEVSPFISQGRTMVPLRIIAESLGAEVDWDSTTRTVIISGREETINLIVDVPLPDDMGTPIIVNGITFVPVRYVSEKLGASVRWDGENNAVYIFPGQPE